MTAASRPPARGAAHGRHRRHVHADVLGPRPRPRHRRAAPAPAEGAVVLRLPRHRRREVPPVAAAGPAAPAGAVPPPRDGVSPR